MILTVTLNAAVDKTYRVENFALDQVHRPSDWKFVAGGKGINVARVYQRLGGRAIATGFLGGYTGRFIERSLRREGIYGEFVRTKDESRVCIAIVDPVSSTQTELNEIGPEIRARELEALKETYGKLVAEHRPYCVTLSGRLPPGVPDGIYAELIEIARGFGVRCALDASGRALIEGVAARPWMVKPNLYELRTLVGRDVTTTDEIASAAERLFGTGVHWIVVTLGIHGCVCRTRECAVLAVPPAVRFVSAVGSGDSFLAAFLWSLEQDRPVDDALRLATAAGAANAATYGAGFVDPREVVRLTEQVQVKAVEPAEVQDDLP